MSYLLDTNHCIYFLNAVGKEPVELTPAESNVLTMITELVAKDEQFYISEVSLGELYYGASLSDREEEKRQKIEDMKVISPVVELSEDVWELFGETKAWLKKKKRRMKDLDLLIACVAKHHSDER